MDLITLLQRVTQITPRNDSNTSNYLGREQNSKGL